MGAVLLREKRTVRAMLFIYCRGNGHRREEKDCCRSCGDLLIYAHERLDKCVFGEEKPVCARCPIHCYHPKQKADITTVMRYSGPKMVLRHPYLSMHHLLSEFKKPGEKVQKYRQRRLRHQHAR